LVIQTSTLDDDLDDDDIDDADLNDADLDDGLVPIGRRRLAVLPR